MKRILTTMAMAVFLIAMPGESHAQGFLKKLKDKAENKLMNAIGLGSKEEEKPQDEVNMEEAEQLRLQQLNAEMMQMSMDMMGSMGGIMDMGAKAAKMTANLTNRFEKQLNEYTAKVRAIQVDPGSIKDCEQIAKEYETELKDVYQQIWAEEDAEKVHELYDRADALMKNYRTRAAGIYRQGLVTKLQNMKTLLPEAEQLYSSMAEDGMIPECSMKRAPLNVVIECIDILKSAYSDFPQPEVLPYKVKVIDLGINKNEYICNGESGYGGSFALGGVGSTGGAAGEAMEEDFKKNSTFLVYNSDENCYYKVNNGVRTRLTGSGPFNYYVKQTRDDSAYGEIPLRGGGRKAVYERTGALILHDGTYCWPMAMQRSGEWLDFIMHNDGKFEVCSYKL